jgi:hypothetical protein
VCAGGDTQDEIGNRTTPKVIRQSGIVDPNCRESVFEMKCIICLFCFVFLNKIAQEN